MKRHLLTMLLVGLCALTASAYDFKVDGICYNITRYSDLTVEVTSGGDYSGSITIPEGVTSVGEYAFYDCSSLTAIILPESVTAIRDYAFYGCSSLTAINIPEGVTIIRGSAFYGCSSLTAVHISSLEAWCNIDFIDSNPLYYAKNLYINGELVTELAIPNSVTAIKDYAFYCCSSLTSITLPEGVRYIGERAFYNCSSLTSINSPEDVRYFGRNAFYGCSSLEQVTINCANVGDWFRGFSSLKKVVLGESVTSIGDYAFSGCSGLKSITIPDGVTYIGGEAFSGCSSLTPSTSAALKHGVI